MDAAEVRRELLTLSFRRRAQRLGEIGVKVRDDVSIASLLATLLPAKK